MLKRFPDYGRDPRSRVGPAEFHERLRSEILGRLHAGWLTPGQKLPSIRDLARETGMDHRAVANAYRLIEAEGLIEVRKTAGVYVADNHSLPLTMEEGASWAAEVLFQSWQRGIRRDALIGLFGSVPSRRLRCGCVESNEDHMLATRLEIEEGFCAETVPVWIDPDAPPGSIGPEEITGVDLLVTSVFHADALRVLTPGEYVPSVVITLDTAFSAEIDRLLSERTITTVIVDPRYAERARKYLEPTRHRGRASFVLVDDLPRAGLDLADPGVLLTRAARRRLGLKDYHLIPSPPTFVSAESARQLCRIMTRITAEQQRPGIEVESPQRASPQNQAS